MVTVIIKIIVVTKITAEAIIVRPKAIATVVLLRKNHLILQ